MNKKYCIFCQQPIDLWDDIPSDPEHSDNYYHAGEGQSIYQCKPCNSQQDFGMVTGKLLNYGFHVGQYGLWFFPKHNIFKIKQYPDEETLLTLEVLPGLTPQNTTVERIKLLLLFS